MNVSDVYSTYRGKHLFFTGVTGFVGKVYLWKVLKEFGADVASIAVLIRTKKGQNPQDRFNKEVMSSPCFDNLKKDLGPDEWKRRASKVYAVAGDIMEDRLGISDADFAKLTTNTNHIVHMAATVNFDERLDISVKMNVLGALRIVSLAQKCRNIQSVVHMSTCYVNYARSGRHQVVREVLYPLPFDSEAMCKFILSQHVNLIPRVTERLMKQYTFANTYTLTKYMAEQIIERRKGNLPMSIIRPAIVGCSFKEPMPGWVDALTAAGGIYLTAGLGILRELYCPGQTVADIVPVDFVVNTTIKLTHKTAVCHAAERKMPIERALTSSAPLAVANMEKGGAATISANASAAAVAAATNVAANTRVPKSGESDGSNGKEAPMPFVFHASTSSSLNVMRWETAKESVIKYWNDHPHPKAIAKAHFELYDSKLEFQINSFLRRTVPLKLMTLAVSLPGYGTPERRKLVKKLEKAVYRTSEMQRQFEPFMTHEWTFDNSNHKFLDEHLNEKCAKAFACDVYDINWHAYTVTYSYGMIMHIMKAPDGRSAPVTPESGASLFRKANL